MIKSARTTSVSLGRKAPSGGPTTRPMPTTEGAGPKLPNGMATFTKEALKPPMMGKEHFNPGRSGGK